MQISSMRTPSIVPKLTKSSFQRITLHICKVFHTNTFSIWLYCLHWFMDRWTTRLNLLVSKLEDWMLLTKLALFKHPSNIRDGGNRMEWNKSYSNQIHWYVQFTLIIILKVHCTYPCDLFVHCTWSHVCVFCFGIDTMAMSNKLITPIKNTESVTTTQLFPVFYQFGDCEIPIVKNNCSFVWFLKRKAKWRQFDPFLGEHLVANNVWCINPPSNVCFFI